MDGMTLDLTKVALLWMAAAIVAIPIMGWTIRLTVEPVLKAVGQWRSESSAVHLEQRLARLEAELARLRSPIHDN